MKTLIVYDTEGYILSVSQGYPLPRTPVGVPYMEVVIPENKFLKFPHGMEIGVDVSKIPHQLILEDIPPSDIDLLRVETAQSNLEMMMIIASMGGM